MADNTKIRKDAENLYEIKEVGIEYSHIMLRERSVINCHEPLTDTRDAQRLAEWLLRNQPAEHGIVICVDNLMRPICYSIVSIGTGNTTVLPVATIAQIGLLSAARGIIFAHNHPTGDIRPSSQDRAATYRLHAALELIGLELIDSLIIGSGYEIPPVYSFRQDVEDPSNPWHTPAAGVSFVAEQYPVYTPGTSGRCLDISDAIKIHREILADAEQGAGKQMYRNLVTRAAIYTITRINRTNVRTREELADNTAARSLHLAEFIRELDKFARFQGAQGIKWREQLGSDTCTTGDFAVYLTTFAAIALR